MQTNKALGQHWLFDEAALAAMVTAGEVADSDTVLEIGPGPGALTERLAATASRVIAVEADAVIARGLHQRVPATNLKVVTSSILEFDLTTLPEGYKVVANIPYYITSKIIRQLLESSNPPTLAALLVQREVAQRVVAQPGEMSVLAFSVQYYATASIASIVPKELFEPVPKVDSAILVLKRHSQPYFAADTKQLFRLVKAGFGERRKKLTNALAGGLHITKDEAAQLLEVAGINPGARAQELHMEEWGQLYNTYEKLRSAKLT